MSIPQDDAAICMAMVRDFDFPRYASALRAPLDKRRAMLALAAFDLEISRIPDQVSQPLPGEVRLQWWIDALTGTEHGGIAGHPVASELLHAIEAHHLTRDPLIALIEAHKFDLYDDAMPSIAGLEVYCDDTAGAFIALEAALLAPTGAQPDVIRDAGRAWGLARLLARLPHDAAHKRCFVPDDLMTRHGVTRYAVLAGDETAGLAAARKELIELARHYLKRAEAALSVISRDARPAFLPLATLNRDLETLSNASPFELVAQPSRLRILASQWWMMR